MLPFFREIRNSFFLSALVSILLGIVLILYPVKTMLLVCYVAGLLLIGCGAILLFRYFTARLDLLYPRTDLFSGGALCFAGVFVILERHALLAVIPVVVGLMVAVSGAASLRNALSHRRLGLERWRTEGLLAALTIVLGIVICLNPFDVIATTNLFIGFCLIWNGACSLYSAYCVSRLE